MKFTLPTPIAGYEAEAEYRPFNERGKYEAFAQWKLKELETTK